MATRSVKVSFEVEGEKTYREAISRINASIKEASSEMEIWRAQFKGQEDSIDALKAKQEILNKIYETQAQKVEETRKVYESGQKAVETYTAKQTELKNKLEQVAQAMNALEQSGSKGSEAYAALEAESQNLQRELTETNGNLEKAEKKTSEWHVTMNKATAQLVKTEREIGETSETLDKKLNPELDETAEKAKDAGDSADDMSGKTAKAIESVENAIQAAKLKELFDDIVGAMRDCIEESIEFETAMAGVFKTVEMSAEEQAVLTDEIKRLAEEIPASASEIAEVAELAGQLGVSKEGILDFTEVMIKLGTATNVSAEEAAESLAQLANIAGTSESDYSRLGSSIVALGNNFATSESKIIAMTTRLASTGTVVGLTESQMLAVATALSSVGIEAEAGGSAISKLLKEIEVAVSSYDTAADVISKTGYSIRDLELMQSHAASDFKALAEEIGITSAELGDYMDTVKSLDQYAEISGQTAEEFKKAWGEDAVVALDSFVSGLGHLDETGGNAVEVLEEMGLTEVNLSNAVLALASSDGILTDALEVSAEAWEENTALSNEAAQRFETTESKVQILKNSFDNFKTALGDDYVSAIDPIIDWLTDFAQGATEVAEATPALSSAIAGLGGALASITGIATAAGGIKLLVSALAGLGPVGIGITAAVAAIGGLTAAATVYTADMRQLSDSSQALIDQTTALTENFDNLKTSFGETMAGITNERSEISLLVDTVYALSEKTSKTAAEKSRLENAVKSLNELLPELGLTYDELTGQINMSRLEMEKFAREAEETAEKAAYENYISELTQSQIDLQVQHEITNAKIAEAREKYDAAHTALREYSDGMTNLQWALRLTDEKYLELATAEAQADSELEQLKRSQVEIQDALKDVNTELDSTQKAYDEYIAKIDETAAKSYASGQKLATLFAEGMKSGESAVARTAESIVESALEKLDDSSAFDIGSNFVSSFARGLEEVGPHVESASSRLAQTAKKTLETALEINSPSKLAIRDGKFFGEGVAIGIEESEGEVSEAIHSLAGRFELAPEIADKFERAVSEIGSFRSTVGDDITSAFNSSVSRAVGATSSRAVTGKSETPIEITVITELDGDVVTKSVSRRQYGDTRLIKRVGGIK